MKIALAVFAKTPLPGAVKTRLTPPLTLEEGAELYRCMLLDTLFRVRELPLDVVVFYEGERLFFETAFPGVALLPQVPGGLGERLVAAVEALHGLGYQGSLVIGSDAPDVPLAYLNKARVALEAGADAVFGPAEDGGYYLVGVAGARVEIFSDIPWSTSLVLATSLQRAQGAGLKAELLPSWYDVDGHEDLLRPGLRESGNGAPLTRAFLSGLDAGKSPQGG